jgi:hypothetical protein
MLHRRMRIRGHCNSGEFKLDLYVNSASFTSSLETDAILKDACMSMMLMSDRRVRSFRVVPRDSVAARPPSEKSNTD